MRTSREDQVRWVSLFRESGLSAKAFCLAHDVVYHRLLYWVSQADARSADDDDVGFVELSSAHAAPSASVAIDAAIELRLGHARLLFGPSVDPRYVASLMRELRA